jgi:hypothetical protein
MFSARSQLGFQIYQMAIQAAGSLGAGGGGGGGA